MSWWISVNIIFIILLLCLLLLQRKVIAFFAKKKINSLTFVFLTVHTPLVILHHSKKKE